MLGNYFLENGIIHQVVERKNKQLLEVARSLIFSTKVPKYLCDEVILSITRVLKHQTPLDFFNMCFVTSRISTNLPLKIFCCTTFIHVHNHNRGKFDPIASKCIFVRYSSIQKGYKYLVPCTKRMFVTIDVTFFY